MPYNTTLYLNVITEVYVMHVYSPAKVLLRRSCLAKIKAVHAILCCLHNMKLKELRNKVK